MLTADDFYVKYNGKAIDDDGAYGAQCVDGFRVFCRYIGIPPYPTKNNWADGYWYYRLEHAADFHFITGSENFKNGDWVIWAKGSRSHPSSHIAMYYNGKEFGQNQGGERSFCLKSTDFSDALGALRSKKLGGKTMELPYGYSTQTVNGITAKVYRGNGLVPFFINSDSATDLKPITAFDSDAIMKEATINCGYFQMRSGQADPVGTHYGVEMDSRIKHYTQSPRQNGIIVFYQRIGETKPRVSEGNDFWYSEDEVLYAFSPYSVRVHDGQKTFYRSTNFGDKDDLKNTQSVLAKLGDDWCVASFNSCFPRDTVTFFEAFGNVRELCVLDSGGSSQLRVWANGSMQTVASGDNRKLANVIVLAKPNTSSGTTEVPAKPTEDDEQAKLQAEVQSLQAENKKLLDANAKMADKIKKALETLNQ